MALAEKEYDRIVRSGWEESRRLVRLANDKTASEKADFEKAKKAFVVSRDQLEWKIKDSIFKKMEVETAALQLQSRETAANDRTAHLDRMEKDLVAREKNIVEREAETRRIKEWRDSAPVGA